MAKDEKTITPQEEVMKLRAVNNALQNQLTQLSQRLQSFEQSTFFARLDWLWRIITWENNGTFGDEFVASKVEEFKELMSPDKKETDSNNE